MPDNPSEQGGAYRRAKDDSERGACQIATCRQASELARKEFEIALDQGEVGSSRVDLPQC